MDDLLRRYRSGDHERVWKEFTPSTGQAVAQETATRIRQNLDLLGQRLRSTGYAFAEDVCPAFSLPPADAFDTLRRAEERLGPVPLAVRSFYEAVGGVDFRAPDGAYAGAPWSRLERADPLVVWPLKEAFESDLETWDGMSDDEREEQGGFELPFSPDHLHKDNVSGGPPCTVAWTPAVADPRVVGEVINTTFLDHLRSAVRGGGFLRMASRTRRSGP